jgi:mycothiol synthase
MSDVPLPWSIRPIQPDEWAEALTLLLAADLPANVLSTAITAVTEHLQKGTLDPAAFFVAVEGPRILGTILGQQLPGAQALLFDVPHAASEHPHAEEIKDALVQALLAWFSAQSVKMVQCLLALVETVRATTLLRSGFHYITELHYLRHFLDTMPLPLESGLEFLRYETTMQNRLAELIAATYVDTLDCPELDGVRSISEVIEGHERGSKSKDHNWWLVRTDDADIGVVLLQTVETENVWDLVYMGLRPEARRRGYGRQLVQFALQQAKEAGVSSVQLSVDVRNTPALRLYQRLGFMPWEEKALFLALLG